MVRQSQPHILLTRPQAQSARFEKDLGLPAVISPLMMPEFLTPPPPSGHFAAVVLTSETGVEAARRISAAGQHLPLTVFCVGRRTANAAAQLGLSPALIGVNLADLAAQIAAAGPVGRLLILRPEDSAGELDEMLVSARIETVSQIVYRQKPCPLTDQAIEILRGKQMVFLPLFSPRSARLFAAEYRRVGGTAPICCIAISAETADAFDLPTRQLQISRQPNGEAMRLAVLELLQDSLGS